ncbi:hypothetical protein CARUB_v10011290mg [Capsella rubella]|uniref:F-box domain-containing protein n=1 Tax=Capsella rubella TaxID=81985 RepID=R0GNN0_9BRAS|nr:hypothetical protein CARUB_v10011290mg [Capsella rubella]
MEWLPHHVVERILEITPVKPLVRFKAVSKQWKSTIECRMFQERQLKHRQQSGDHPDILMVSVALYFGGCTDPDMEPSAIESLRTLSFDFLSSDKIPTPWENDVFFVSRASCDGLACLYYPITSDGFGKDKFTGTCKPVWLYNSTEVGLENTTTSTCEVFDFSTNSWRYVTPPAPHCVTCHDPAFVDGSLYCFTDDSLETQILSLDLHTEAFQVISKVPFPKVRNDKMVISNLDNRLCVSTNKKFPNQDGFYQDIWSFNPENKTWDKIYSIDLLKTEGLDVNTQFAVIPLAVFDEAKKKKKKKKKKLLYYQIICYCLHG